jgi:hypothetical protein
MRVALGFRAHSGWAAVVAVAGTVREPRVLDRRRIVIADPDLPGSKQPFHAAEDLPLLQAQALVTKAIESSRSLAAEAIAAVAEALRKKGHEVVACGLVLGSGKALPDLEKILASHALIHTAEGEMFRDVLRHAAQACGLPVTGIREKAIASELPPEITTLGKAIGPPWTQDQKYAALAGLMALTAA